MSHTLNAIDSDDVHYLLLDCTEEERDQLNSYFLFNIFNPLKVNQLKKVVASLTQADLNALPFGMLKRNLVNLMGLTELDDIVAVSCGYDTSNPTSDYRYPVLSYIPQGMDVDSDDNLVPVVINDTESYFYFCNYVVPKELHHVTFLVQDLITECLYMGKTTNGNMFVYTIDVTGHVSDDLSYTIS